MSRTGNWLIAQTEGTRFTLYAVMVRLGLTLTEEQAETQKKLEALYPEDTSQCGMCNPNVRKACSKYRNAW